MQITNEIIEFIATIFSVIGLIGAYFNSKGKIFLSYQIWIITNLFFVWYNVSIGSLSQIFSNSCYFVLAIVGYLHYRGTA